MTGRSRLTMVALLAVAAGCGREAPAVAAIGRLAPPYAATRLEGGLTSLSDHRGKVILLNVWATWCAPCRQEIPYLQSLYDTHAMHGLEIIGVSVDARGSESAIRDFQKDFGIRYPIWLDPDERVQTLYLALGVPASYLIDREGVLRWKHLGIVRPTDSTFTTALRDALGPAAAP